MCNVGVRQLNNVTKIKIKLSRTVVNNSTCHYGKESIRRKPLRMALVLCFDLLKFPFGPNVNAMNTHQVATIYLCGGNSYAAYT